MEAGTALDALVAEKVMGWIRDGDGDLRAGNPPVQIGRFKLDCLVPSYSADISAAWSVLERFEWPKFYTHLTKTDKGNWRCDIESNGGDGPTYSAYHKNAPTAICLAALKAIGERK